MFSRLFRPPTIFRPQSRTFIQTAYAPSTTIAPTLAKQECLLLSDFPFESTNLQENLQRIQTIFSQAGYSIPLTHILPMNSLLQKPTGKVLILTNEASARQIKPLLPSSTKIRTGDQDTIHHFVETCEAFHRQSQDLLFLSQPTHIDRTATLIEVPPSYTKKDVQDLILTHARVQVPLKNIFFRYNAKGGQRDMVWVLCNTEKDSMELISSLQEIPVPRVARYEGLYGCNFVFASRLSLFLSDPSLDYQLPRVDPTREKFQVALLSWHKDVAKEDIHTLLASIKLGCYDVTEYYCEAKGVKHFFLQFDSMQKAKQAMRMLSVLKRRWRVHPLKLFYAYPKNVDIHFEDQDKYDDEDSCDDDDIDEPIHY